MANRPGPQPWPPKYGTLSNVTSSSGYTPVRPTFPSLPNIPDISASQQVRNTRNEQFQKGTLKGFTTRELVDLDVITNARLKPSTLRTDCPIHPLFASARWEVTPSPDHQRTHLYPLPNRPGLSGMWIYENPIVKNAIMPALRIATQIMNSIHMLPWLTALMDYGGMTTIAANRFDPIDLKINPRLAGNLKSFTPAGPLTPAMGMAASAKFNQLSKKLTQVHNFQLGFSKISEDPWNAQPVVDCSGITYADYKGTVFTFLATSTVEPLLRPDLTDAERMGCEWNIANTLIHETCHALWSVMMDVYKIPIHNEPYLENEPVAELGFAMEHAVFGGVGDRMIEDPNLCSIGYWLSVDNTALDIASRSVDIILKSPPVNLIQHKYPIKAEFFENMQQDDFWEANIAIYGWRALHARTLTVGVEVTMKGQLPLGRYGDIPSEESFNRLAVADDRVEDFRIDLQDYIRDYGPQLSGLERRNVAVGRAIITNSVYEEAFWRKTSETREFLELVVTSLKYVVAGKTVAERRDALDQIVAFLGSAEVKHLEVIDAFHHLPRNLQRQDRLDDLLRWNRGARIYAKGCFDLISDDPAYMATGAILERRQALEFCRMLLFAPGDNTMVMSYSEQTLIAEANQRLGQGQVDSLKNTLATLSSIEDGSLFVEGVRKILASEVAYLPFTLKGVALSGVVLTDTYTQTRQAVDMLSPLRNMNQTGRADTNLQKWAAELDRWLERANDLLDICRATAASLPARIQ